MSRWQTPQLLSLSFPEAAILSTPDPKRSKNFWKIRQNRLKQCFTSVDKSHKHRSKTPDGSVSPAVNPQLKSVSLW
jgi:hypothetical protein